MLIVLALAFSSVACSEETRDRLSDIAASRSPSRSVAASISVSARPSRSPPPTEQPTQEPTPEPTEEPDREPTEEPTREPTREPTEERTEDMQPSSTPTDVSSSTPLAAEQPPADESSGWPVVLFVSILVGVAVAAYAIIRRRSASSAGGRSGPP